jgi:hypothetical protein
MKTNHKKLRKSMSVLFYLPGITALGLIYPASVDDGMPEMVQVWCTASLADRRRTIIAGNPPHVRVGGKRRRAQGAAPCRRVPGCQQGPASGWRHFEQAVGRPKEKSV